MAKGFSYREGMANLIQLAIEETRETKTTEAFQRDMEAFIRVTKALCSKAKRADKKALKALAYLQEAGAITPAEYEEKIKAISGLDDDVIRATQWPRGVLEVVSKVIEETLEALEKATEESKTKPKETKTEKPQKESKAA